MTDYTLPYYVEYLTDTHAVVSLFGDEKQVPLGEFAGKLTMGDFVFIEAEQIVRQIEEADAIEILEMVEQGTRVDEE